MTEKIIWEQVNDESEQGKPGTVYFKVDQMPDGVWMKRIVSKILDDDELHHVITREPYWQRPKEGESALRVPDGEIKRFKEGYQYAKLNILEGTLNP